MSKLLHHKFFLILFLAPPLCLCLCLSSCKTSSDLPDSKTDTYEFISLNNFQIPRLNGAKQQLTYGLSSFEDPENKKAALEAVLHLYPDKNVQTGLAALELGYLRLGQDFRLTTKENVEQACQNYGEIVKEYNSIPEIVAKALWYQGWIYSDLLDDFDSGKKTYHRLIKQYPKQKIRLHPPPPWLSLHSEDTPKSHKPYFSQSKLTWAAMAWLEILRHEKTEQDGKKAFANLQQHDAAGILFVPAIRIMVTNYGLSHYLEDTIRDYLQDKNLDEDLQKDLLFLLTDNVK